MWRWRLWFLALSNAPQGVPLFTFLRRSITCVNVTQMRRRFGANRGIFTPEGAVFSFEVFSFEIARTLLTVGVQSLIEKEATTYSRGVR